MNLTTFIDDNQDVGTLIMNFVGIDGEYKLSRVNTTFRSYYRKRHGVKEQEGESKESLFRRALTQGDVETMVQCRSLKEEGLDVAEYRLLITSQLDQAVFTVASQYIFTDVFDFLCEKGYMYYISWFLEGGTKITQRQLHEGFIAAISSGHLDIMIHLIQHSCYKPKQESECLERAASRGHLHIVKYLIEFIIKLNTPNGAPIVETALRVALKANHEHVAEYLIDHLKTLNWVMGHYFISYLFACNEDIYERLSERIGMEQRRRELMQTSTQPHFGLAIQNKQSHFYKKNVEKFHQDPESIELYFTSIIEANDEDLIQIVPVTRRSLGNGRALEMCCIKGNIMALKRILESDTIDNFHIFNINRSIEIAAENNHLHICRYLLQFNSGGAKQILRQGVQKALLMGSVECAEELMLKHGAQTICDIDKTMRLIRTGNIRVIQLILSRLKKMYGTRIFNGRSGTTSYEEFTLVDKLRECYTKFDLPQNYYTNKKCVERIEQWIVENPSEENNKRPPLSPPPSSLKKFKRMKK